MPTTQIYDRSKQLSSTEKDICNTLVKDYDDNFVRNKVMHWWNTKYPDNPVQENPNIYGVDLVGINNPNFCIEVERSFSWKTHHRPNTFNTVRIPVRKARYWLPRNSETIFIQVNKDATSCVLLRDEIVREKAFSRILMTNVGYREHFLEYYTWEYYEM